MVNIPEVLGAFNNLLNIYIVINKNKNTNK